MASRRGVGATGVALGPARATAGGTDCGGGWVGAFVLALDPRMPPGELADHVALVSDVLGPRGTVTVVGPAAVEGHAHRPVPVTLPARRRGAGPLGRVVRMAQANADSRAAWRALQADAAAMAELRGADLVAVVDPLGHRAGWALARRHGVRALTGSRALRYALRTAQ